MLSRREVFPTDTDKTGRSVVQVNFLDICLSGPMFWISRWLTFTHHLNQAALTYHRHSETHQTLLSSGGGLFYGSHNSSQAQAWALAYRGVHDSTLAGLFPEAVQTYRRFISLCGGEEDHGSTPVHEALISSPDHQRLPRLREALLAHPQCINVLDGAGAAPIHWTVPLDNVSAARLLLEFGADVDCKDSQGNTALYRAAYKGKLDLVELLLENGADVASCCGELDIEASGMCGTASPQMVITLLAHGSDPNKKFGENGGRWMRALQYICGEFWDDVPGACLNSTRKLDLMLDAGADIDQLDYLGRSPLLYAGLFNDTTYIRLLLERGADPGLTDGEGRGLLHYVALYTTAKTMDVIRLHHSDSQDQEYPLDVGAKDNNGVTAVEYFKSRVEAMPQLPEPVGGLSSPKSSMKPVSREDIEEWVMLIEDLQSCSKHVHMKEQ